MEHKYPLCDLEMASYRLRCAVDTLRVVYESIEHGPDTAESYKDALCGAYYHLFTIANEIQDCNDALFKQKKKEAEVTA